MFKKNINDQEGLPPATLAKYLLLQARGPFAEHADNFPNFNYGEQIEITEFWIDIDTIRIVANGNEYLLEASQK